MIEKEQFEKFVLSMKANTLTAFKENQYSKMPIVMNDGDEVDYNGNMVYEKCHITPVKKYHFKGKWKYYKYSDDVPENIFGILRVDNLPYSSFYNRLDRDSFMSSLGRLISKDYLIPFMLFIDNKFVNWNDISVVFDCGVSYLLLHGEKYNWVNLFNANKFNIVLLPFKIDYIGVETNISFENNYNALFEYLKLNTTIDSNNVMKIKVPTMDTEFHYNNMDYSIGYWLYNQIRLFSLGVLQKERIDKLKKINLIKYIYNENGVIIDTKLARFNALDNDTYVDAQMASILHGSMEDYKKHKFMSFNNKTGLLDMDKGDNTFYIITDKMYYDHISSSDDVVYTKHPDINNPLQKNNYLIFIDGKISFDVNIEMGYANYIRIKNNENKRYDVFTLYHKDSNEVYSVTSKLNKDYLDAIIGKYFNLNYSAKDGLMVFLTDDDGNETGEVIKRLDFIINDHYHDSTNIMGKTPKDGSHLSPNIDNSFITVHGDTLFSSIVDPTGEYTSIYLDDGTPRIPIQSITEDYFKDDILNKFNLRDLTSGDTIEVILKRDYSLFSRIVDNVSGMDDIDNTILSMNGVESLHGGTFISNITDKDGKIVNEQYDGHHVFINPKASYMVILINDGLYVDAKNKLFNNLLVKNEDLSLLKIYDVGTVPPDTATIDINYRDSIIKEYLKFCFKYLDFNLSDKKDYSDNVSTAKLEELKYDVTLFNDLYDSNVICTTIDGEEANRQLEIPNAFEYGRGLKIPRQKYFDHETYCLVFLNGDLFEFYSSMIVYHDFFFIPVPKEYSFDGGDYIEFMYFTGINNNEYTLTEKAIDSLITTKSFLKYSEEYQNYYTIDKDFMYGDNDLTVSYIDNSDNLYQFNKDEIKVFAQYPNYYLQYEELINKDDRIAFNIGTLYNNKIHLLPYNIKSYGDITLVSKYKFIYQRIYPASKGYRFRLDKRFRYCDNSKQYMLFINGRRIHDSSFFITIPKISRPFWGIYLYTSKFVSPEDRVEVVYVPIEMEDINRNDKFKFDSNGYIEAMRRDKLNTPLDPKFYQFFINGKKIPSKYLKPVGTSMLKVTKDIKATTSLVVNKIVDIDNKELINYYNGTNECLYDKIISFVRKSYGLGMDELNNLIGSWVKMSDVETDKLTSNVDRIAILNELIRDFWVSSGYNYTEPFMYDYEIDRFITKNGDLLELPSLDATREINIPKNDVRLLYFLAEPDIYYEKGNQVHYIRFIWEYSNSIYNKDIEPNIISQKINGMSVDVSSRLYDWTKPINDDLKVTLITNTPTGEISASYDIKFIDPIFYGCIDEDFFEGYKLPSLLRFDKTLMAMVPKDGKVPTNTTLNIYSKMNGILQELYKDYFIYNNLGFENSVELNDSYTLIDSLVALVQDDYNHLMDGSMDIDAEENTFEQLKLKYEHFILNNYDLPGITGKVEEISEYKFIKPRDDIELMNDIIENSTETNINNLSDVAVYDNFWFIEELSKEDKPPYGIIEDNSTTPINPSVGADMIVRLEDFDTFALFDNGTATTGEFHIADTNFGDLLIDDGNLSRVINYLDKQLQPSPEINVQIPIGNHKYFVYAIPKYMYYSNNLPSIYFSMHDLIKSDFKKNGINPMITPKYTDGTYEDNGDYKSLDKMTMYFLGECDYINEYGHKETYVICKSDGYFIDLHPEYNISIKSKKIK